MQGNFPLLTRGTSKRLFLLRVSLIRFVMMTLRHSQCLPDSSVRMSHSQWTLLVQHAIVPREWLPFPHQGTAFNIHTEFIPRSLKYPQFTKLPLACQLPCFKSPTAFVVHIWQTHALPPYLSLLNPDELPCEGKCNTNLVQKQW